MPIPRVLLHLTGLRRRAIDPAEVYYLEADGDETLIRLYDKRRLRDVRSLGELGPQFMKHGFFQIHGSFAVNPLMVRELRPRKNSKDWELRLEPPVGKVLPISRSRLKALLAQFGDDQ